MVAVISVQCPYIVLYFKPMGADNSRLNVFQSEVASVKCCTGLKSWVLVLHVFLETVCLNLIIKDEMVPLRDKFGKLTEELSQLTL